MGLFSFIKSAGEKVFGSAAEEKKIEAEIQATNPVADRIEELKKARAMALKVESMDLAVENLGVTVSGGRVTVTGQVASQEISEKVALTVGNLGGVESVDNQLEVTNPEPEATFYTVVSGDSLSKIAKTHYGNAMKYPAIFEANKPMLSHPDKIYPGQVLRIPPMED